MSWPAEQRMTLKEPPRQVVRQPGIDSIKFAYGEVELGAAGFVKRVFPMDRVVCARLEPDGMATVILTSGWDDEPAAALARKKAA